MTARRVVVAVSLIQLGLGVVIGLLTWGHVVGFHYSLMYIIPGLLGLGVALTCKLRIPCLISNLYVFVIGVCALAGGAYSLVLPETNQAPNIIRFILESMVMATLSGSNSMAVFRLRDQVKTASASSKTPTGT